MERLSRKQEKPSLETKKFNREKFRKLLSRFSEDFFKRIVLPALILFTPAKALSKEAAVKELERHPLSPKELELSEQHLYKESLEKVKARCVLSALNNQDLIKEHGGKIRFNSSEGSGTEFIIELPCHSK